MDDKESKSPWGQLAQDLGAKPSSKAFERSQPPAIEIPTTDSEETSEEPQQAASDWNALAGSLGLEVPESSQPEAESSPPAAEPVPVEEPVPSEEIGASFEPESYADEVTNDEATDSLPPLPSEVDQIMSEGDWDSEEVTDEAADETSDDDLSSDEDAGSMSALAAKNAFDSLFNAEGSALAIPPAPRKMSEERSLDAEQSADSSDAEASTGNSEEGDKEERPKRKRSRRRRGRGRGRKSEAEKTSDDETSSEATVEDQDAELNGEDRKDSSREDSTEEDEKTRRRRPRRRSRRSASADSSKGEESEADDNESLDTLTYGDNELAEDRGSSSRDSIGHRNMPTWAEALSGIIEGNLELHSKTPSRQTSSRGRGRGGRGGRGRGRGSKS